VGGRGLKVRRRTGGAVIGVRAVRQQEDEEQAPRCPGEIISQSQANRIHAKLFALIHDSITDSYF
jgi:hypothetical protein